MKRKIIQKLKDEDSNLNVRTKIPSNSNEFKWYVQTFLQTADSIYNFLNQNGEDYTALQLLQQYYKLNKKKEFPA